MNNEPQSASQSLIAGLDRQIDALEQLRACLEEENLALQARDPEQILSIAERKAAVITQASRFTQERSAPATPATSAEIQSRHERLEVLARTCKDLNDINGAMIRRQKDRTEATLRIFRGDSTEPAGGVYGPGGETGRSTKTRRTLASI